MRDCGSGAVWAPSAAPLPSRARAARHPRPRHRRPSPSCREPGSPRAAVDAVALGASHLSNPARDPRRRRQRRRRDPMMPTTTSTNRTPGAPPRIAGAAVGGRLVRRALPHQGLCTRRGPTTSKQNRAPARAALRPASARSARASDAERRGSVRVRPGSAAGALTGTKRAPRRRRRAPCHSVEQQRPAPPAAAVEGARRGDAALAGSLPPPPPAPALWLPPRRQRRRRPPRRRRRRRGRRRRRRRRRPARPSRARACPIAGCDAPDTRSHDVRRDAALRDTLAGHLRRPRVVTWGPRCARRRRPPRGRRRRALGERGCAGEVREPPSAPPQRVAEERQTRPSMSTSRYLTHRKIRGQPPRR